MNEVTLFRYFGSKEALLQEAIANTSETPAATTLPAIPVDPDRELAEWCSLMIERLHAKRSIIRKCMSEIEERPEMITTAVSTPVRAANDLAAYLRKLKSMGLAQADFDVAAAGSMLLGCSVRHPKGCDSIYCSGPFAVPGMRWRQILPPQGRGWTDSS